MKQYDHEPTLEELFAQLAKEDAFLPSFIPPIKVPIMGKFIEGKIKEGMTESVITSLLT